MKATVFLFLIPLSFAQCPDYYTYDEGVESCFKVSSKQENYFTAQHMCNLDGGNLATIENAFVNTFIGNLLQLTITDYYIGLNKVVTGDWAWLDKTNVSYTNWDVGIVLTDSDSCAVYNGEHSKWRNEDCDVYFFYICMTKANES